MAVYGGFCAGGEESLGLPSPFDVAQECEMFVTMITFQGTELP